MPVPGDIAPFLVFVRPLIESNLRFMVTGSVAAMVFGEPRLTNDVDLVLFLPENSVARVTKLFPLNEFYCPPEEMIEIESSRPSEGHFNLIHHETGLKADVYLVGENSLRIWGLNRVIVQEFQGIQIPIAPPEYVILSKLEYFRSGGSEKHVRDIRAMLLVSGDKIDIKTIDEKAFELGLQETWSEVKGDFPS